MIHSIGYLGRYDENFERLALNSDDYIKDGKVGGKNDKPSKKVDGIFFGYLEKPKRQFFAVRASFLDHRVNLENPIRLDPPRHTDGKGFFQPPQFGDTSATNLLMDMMAANPSQAVELTQIGTKSGLLKDSRPAAQPQQQQGDRRVHFDQKDNDEEQRIVEWRQIDVRLRNASIANEVKKMYEYRCQLCGETILLGEGRTYAEAHHIKPLGSHHEGPDILENVLSVCPNHHVQLDYGAIQIIIDEIEISPEHGDLSKHIQYHNTEIFGATS
jgi:hypothetical protein